MVICTMVGCGNRSGRDKEKRFFRLPTVSVDRGEQTLELSKQRQDIWLARIKREDLERSRYNNVRVCSDHFVSGESAKLYEKIYVELIKGERRSLNRLMRPTLHTHTKKNNEFGMLFSVNDFMYSIAYF